MCQMGVWVEFLRPPARLVSVGTSARKKREYGGGFGNYCKAGQVEEEEDERKDLEWECSLRLRVNMKYSLAERLGT